MSGIHVTQDGVQAATVKLIVKLAPHHDGNLDHGLLNYVFEPRTSLMGANALVTVELEDHTGLELRILDYMSTLPAHVTGFQTSPITLALVFEKLPVRQLVFYSIVLCNESGDLILCCDPQVGNDPKV